jgi:hypothetical protein
MCRPCGGLEVGERIQHGGGAVEVGGQPLAAVAVQQRIQAQLQLARQVGGDDLVCQRQVLPVRGRHALAPAAAHRGHPASAAGAGVLPPQRVHVGPGAEQAGEERDLRRRRGTGVRRSRLAVEDAGLHGAGWARLPRRQFQQSEEPGVLRPQPGDLLAQRRQLVVQTDQRQRALISRPGRNRHDSILSRERDFAAGPAAATCRGRFSARS